MSNGAAARKSVELDQKLRALRAELEMWEAASKTTPLLQKHHRQIKAVRETLARPLKQAQQRLDDARDAQTVLAEAFELETMILELHRIWGFFRSKLALRYVEHFRQPLLVTSELAWRCFEPAERFVAEGEGLEPPLVYFSGASSPLTRERGESFHAEYAEGEGIGSDVAAAALDSLPVPVLGIPWFQADHLPDTPIIAHEVGHDVEVDLDLGPRVRALIDESLRAAGADLDHRDAWREWAGEVFADVYGVLALGPAFASMLVDFLAGDPEEVAEERLSSSDWGKYPTTALRLLLVAAVLDATRFAKQAKETRAVVPDHAMRDYDGEAKRVAEAIVRGPYPQLWRPRQRPAPLTRLIAFPKAWATRATRDAGRLLRGSRPLDSDARVLIAAARLAFDRDPQLYVEKSANQWVLDRVEEKQDVGTRGGPPEDPKTAEAVAERTQRRNRAAGERLLAVLEEGAARKRARSGGESGT